MKMNNVSAKTKINSIIERAKKDPRKGKYYVYEQYKSELQNICESSIQYEQAIYELAKALRV